MSDTSPSAPAALPAESDNLSAIRPGGDDPSPVDPSSPAADADAPAVDPAAPYGRKPDGTPRAKPGRKPGSASQSAPAAPADPADDKADRLRSVSRKPAQRAATPDPNYHAMGVVCASAFFTVGTVALGGEFAPEPDDVPAVSDAFADYLRAKGVTAIDPGVVLALTLGAYVLKKMERPTVRERIIGAYVWLKGRASKIFKRG